MSSQKNPVWAELVQLLPILMLALPFVAKGEVDVSRAATSFLPAALVTVPVTAFVLQRRHVLNPILVGTDLWLWLGALAFTLPVPALAAWLTMTQASSLFFVVLAVGVLATFASKQGFIGFRTGDARFVQRASLLLLGLGVLAAGWAFSHRANVRLGGGLPFIVLNVVRRVLIVRAITRGARG